MLLAAGEEISISLLTMALQELGVSAISLTGWQAGFNTDRAYSKARIKRLDTERVESELARNRVVVVAGFQGLNRSDDITTLGRGAAIPPPWRWPLRCTRIAARSSPMSRASTPQTRARSPRQPKLKEGSRLTRCSSWRPWARRC